MSTAYNVFTDLEERIVEAIAKPMDMAHDFFKNNIIAEDFRSRENLEDSELIRKLVDEVADDIRRHPRHIKTVIKVMRRYKATKALADELDEGRYNIHVYMSLRVLCWTKLVLCSIRT